FQAEDGIRDLTVTGVQTCALPISPEELRKLARANNYDLGIATEILVGRILDDAAELAKGRGVNMIKPLTVSGDPASATVKAAKRSEERRVGKEWRDRGKRSG